MTHMFFVDDIYIYCQANKCQANKEEATQVMKVLATFERASGQKIDVDKSNVFFSRNVQADS